MLHVTMLHFLSLCLFVFSWFRLTLFYVFPDVVDSRFTGQVDIFLESFTLFLESFTLFLESFTLFLKRLTFSWNRLHFSWKTEEEILRKIQSSFVVISWFICIFANVKAHASVSGRGQRHNGKRHWCFVFGYLKLPQIQINQSKA